jgi:hypothetical protein
MRNRAKGAGFMRMVGNPQECREHAKECLEQARTAPTLLVMTKLKPSSFVAAPSRRARKPGNCAEAVEEARAEGQLAG